MINYKICKPLGCSEIHFFSYLVGVVTQVMYPHVFSMFMTFDKLFKKFSSYKNECSKQLLFFFIKFNKFHIKCLHVSITYHFVNGTFLGMVIHKYLDYTPKNIKLVLTWDKYYFFFQLLV